MRAKIMFTDQMQLLDYQVVAFRYPKIGEYYIHDDCAVLAQVNFTDKKLIVYPIK